MIETKSKTNTHWYPYKEHGSYYKLIDGILYQCAMHRDGTREDNLVEVDWNSGVSKAEEQRLIEIVEELEGKE
jgi:hypothetical protein